MKFVKYFLFASVFVLSGNSPPYQAIFLTFCYPCVTCLQFRFVVKNNGVLYEDEVIQIGCKLEARTNLARLGMFYGNKTLSPFTDFTPIVSCPGSLAVQLQAQVSSCSRLDLGLRMRFSVLRFKPKTLHELKWWEFMTAQGMWTRLSMEVFAELLWILVARKPEDQRSNQKIASNISFLMSLLMYRATNSISVSG